MALTLTLSDAAIVVLVGIVVTNTTDS
jgi:hypothetical protein